MGRFADNVKGHRVQSQRARAKRDNRTELLRQQRRGEHSPADALAPQRVNIARAVKVATSTAAPSAALRRQMAATANDEDALHIVDDGHLANMLRKTSARNLVIDQFTDAVRARQSALAIVAYLSRSGSNGDDAAKVLEFALLVSEKLVQWHADPPKVLPPTEQEDEGAAPEGTDDGAAADEPFPFSALLTADASGAVVAATIKFLRGAVAGAASADARVAEFLALIGAAVVDAVGTGDAAVAMCCHHVARDVLCEVIASASSFPAALRETLAALLSDLASSHATQLSTHRHGSRVLIAAMAQDIAPAAGAAPPAAAKKGRTPSKPSAAAAARPSISTLLARALNVTDARKLKSIVVHPIGIEVVMALADAAAREANAAQLSDLASTIITRLPAELKDGGDDSDAEQADSTAAESASASRKASQRSTLQKGTKRSRDESEGNDKAPAMSLREALETAKRFGRLLRHLLEVTFKIEGARAASAPLVAQIGEALAASNIVETAQSFQCNFVVQAVIRRAFESLAFAGSETDRLRVLLDGIAKAFLAKLDDVISHPIAGHCFAALCSAAAGAPTHDSLTAVMRTLQSRFHGLAVNKHASLALRRLVEAAGADDAEKDAASTVASSSTKKGKQSAAAASTDSVADAFLEALLAGPTADAVALASNESGNLVIQALLKNGKNATLRDRFIRDVVVPKAADLSQHQFGAFVVSVALSTASPAVHMQVFGALKPVLTRLATHLNGRFVVQSLVGHRECQDALLSQFKALASATGTQHLFAHLYRSGDANVRQRVAKAAVEAGLVALATAQASSMVLQRLLEVDVTTEPAHSGPVLEAVKGALAKDTTLKATLERDFFGKFVIAFVDPEVATRLKRRDDAMRSAPARGGAGKRHHGAR